MTLLHSDLFRALEVLIFKGGVGLSLGDLLSAIVKIPIKKQSQRSEDYQCTEVNDAKDATDDHAGVLIYHNQSND